VLCGVMEMKRTLRPYCLTLLTTYPFQLTIYNLRPGGLEL
jgi:hypothetical protein